MSYKKFGFPSLPFIASLLREIVKFISGNHKFVTGKFHLILPIPTNIENRSLDTGKNTLFVHVHLTFPDILWPKTVSNYLLINDQVT